MSAVCSYTHAYTDMPLGIQIQSVAQKFTICHLQVLLPPLLSLLTCFDSPHLSPTDRFTMPLRRDTNKSTEGSQKRYSGAHHDGVFPIWKNESVSLSPKLAPQICHLTISVLFNETNLHANPVRTQSGRNIALFPVL